MPGHAVVRVRFRRVQRSVGSIYRRRRSALNAGKGDTNAGRNRFANRERLPKSTEHTLGDFIRLVTIGRLQQDEELVAAKPGDFGRHLRGCVHDSLGRFAQEFVARAMAMPVVHGLETVEIDVEQRLRTTEDLAQTSSVQQTRHRVVLSIPSCLLPKPHLILETLADNAERLQAHDRDERDQAGRGLALIGEKKPGRDLQKGREDVEAYQAGDGMEVHETAGTKSGDAGTQPERIGRVHRRAVIEPHDRTRSDRRHNRGNRHGVHAGCVWLASMGRMMKHDRQDRGRDQVSGEPKQQAVGLAKTPQKPDQRWTGRASAEHMNLLFGGKLGVQTSSHGGSDRLRFKSETANRRC